MGINLYKTIRTLGLRSFIKSLKFNLHYFGLKKGCRLPVFVSKNVLFNKMRGEVILDSINTGHIRIGFGSIGIFDRKYDRTVLEFCDGAKIIFCGNCNIGHGSKISVQNNAVLTFGKYFCITSNSTIICAKKINFGNNVLISWDVQIMDTDFHKIYNNGVLQNPDKEILVGDDVWINSRVVILKGSVISNGCVVGAMSLLNKEYKTFNRVLVGVPCHEIRNTNILWER